MAIIPFPSGVKIKNIQWQLDRPTQVNRSGWTGRRQVFGIPGHARWVSSFEFAPIVGEPNVRALRSFLFSLKGQVNTFRLVAVEGAQNANSGVTVSSTAAAGAVSVTLTGASQAMVAGQMMTINDQLLGITNVSGNVITFEPPLRASASGGTAVETSLPSALVALTDSSVGWTVDPGKLYGAALSVEEAF